MKCETFDPTLCSRDGSCFTCAIEFQGDVQEVGYRLKAWTIALGHKTVDKGRLENLGNNQMRIYLSSQNPQELEQAYTLFCKEDNVPKTAKVSSIKQVDANGTSVLPAGRVTDILMLEQQSKGVDYIKTMATQIAKMNEQIDGMREDISKTNEQVGGMRNDIKAMNKKFDELPERIADKLDKNFDNLGKKFDKLPERIAKAMKAA